MKNNHATPDSLESINVAQLDAVAGGCPCGCGQANCNCSNGSCGQGLLPSSVPARPQVGTFGWPR